ncbi:hypothetical protein [Mycolicibacterium tusciae]|uniref:hypothetical protein n=1 Tax=Mycolicibacterium tusciae TaxID=75922 RepID=UPI00024A1B25|nr:hypothetical protein [Mycolicibacterium tusciae]
MNPDELPAGHVVARRLVIIATLTAVAMALIWFYAAKVQTGDVGYWYYQFKYEQDNLFYTLFHAWKFPWD